MLYNRKQNTQQENENRLKNLQIQSLILIKQLKECLEIRSYRQTVKKVEKFIAYKKHDISDISAQIFLKILFLQSKSVIKLIERNIFKKYYYQEFQMRILLKIINRNNYLANSILVTKIQSKQILDQNRQGFFNNQENYHSNIFKSNISEKDFQKLSKSFCEIYLASILYGFVNFKNYSLNIDKWQNCLQLVENLAQNCTKFSFKIQFATVELKILIGKNMFEKGNFQSSLKVINKVIQNLLNLHYKIRIWNEYVDLHEQNINKKLICSKKTKYYIKKIFKLLMISTILMIRNNMKAGSENMVIQGIKIFNFIYQKTDVQLNSFRKYLNPEVYIFQQYCQYRAQKFEWAKIIEPLFLGNIHQFANNSSERDSSKDLLKTQNRNSIFQFYNQKMVQFQQKITKQERRNQLKRTANKNMIQSNNQLNLQNANELQKLNTNRGKQNKKSRQTKSRIGSSNYSTQSFTKGSVFLGNRFSSTNFLNIQKFIIDQIQKSNLAHLTQRSQGSKQFGRFGFNINNNQRGSHFNEEKLQQGKQIANSESVKVGIKSIGNAFQKKSKIFTNNIERTKQNTNKKIVKSAFIRKSLIQENNESLKDQKKNSTILQVAQKIKFQQKIIFKDLKNNIQLLKGKKNSKLNLLNKIYQSKIQNDWGLYEIKPHQNSISDSFVEEKYMQLKQNNQLHVSIEKEKISVDNRQRKNSSSLGHKFKQKFKYLNKKSKTQMFIELLTKNKEYLGIKKWSQKIQYLKKKEELKQKLRSTRKTTSLGYNKVPGLPANLSILAGDILRYSLEQIEQFGLNAGNADYKKSKHNLKLDNENNYKLGQKSIEILMSRLQKQKESIIKNEKQNRKNKLYTTQRYQPSQNKLKGSHTRHYSSKKRQKSLWCCKFML